MDDFVELSPEAARRIGEAAGSLRPGDTLGLPVIGHNLPPLPELLKEEAEALAKRRDELLAAVTRVPETIEDEATSGRVTDLVKLMIRCRQQAKKDHDERKAPFLLAGKQIDAAYATIIDPLARAQIQLEDRQTAYQRRKAEAERRAREEEARRQAAEAERLRREAEEAAAALETEDDLEAALAAEEEAQQRAAEAEERARAAAAPVAELSRSRGEYGSVSSLQTYWEFDRLDRNTIDLNTLRPYLPLDAIEKAIRAFIRSGGRELKGCRIFQNSKSRTR